MLDIATDALSWATMFTLLATAISLYQVKNHLVHNLNPSLRKYTIRILLMVPIYAVESLLGMIFHHEAIGLAMLRECYESLALYSFFQYLVVCLGGKFALADMLCHKPPVKHVWPLCRLRPWTMGTPFLQLSSVGILQYVPIKIMCSIAALITGFLGCYGDGEFRTDRAYPWLALIVNFSQMWALYCLVLFYLGTKEELAPTNPIGKIASIKLIIFFTWWQSIAFAAAVHLRIIKPDWFGKCVDSMDCHAWTVVHEISQSLQDLIICIEMLGFAIAHHYCFPIPNPVEYDQTRREDWETSGEKADKEHTYQNLLEAVNVSEVVQDVRRAQAPMPVSYQASGGQKTYDGSYGF